VEEYIRTGRDQNIVDPDPHNVYTKRKEHQTVSEDNISAVVNAPQTNYPLDGWSGDIKRMPFFMHAEMNDHITKSGKNIDLSKSHSVPTSVRKGTMFLNDEYLKNLSAASDNTYFYLRCQCHHSFRKNDPSHNLKVALYPAEGNQLDIPSGPAKKLCLRFQVARYSQHLVVKHSVMRTQSSGTIYLAKYPALTLSNFKCHVKTYRFKQAFNL